MSAPAIEDAAWVKLALPIPVVALNEFVLDVERLLRINPCIEFERLARNPDGAWRLEGRNESNEQAIATAVRVLADPDHRGLALFYDSGLKRETRLEIEAAPDGAVLTITEVYDTPAPEERESRLPEVDRSLMPWAAALRRHLLRRQRWGRLPGYRWLVERFWLGMPPRQRRVARLIIWTTLLEFVVFLAVMAIYVAD
jgi:hypothetical protein